MTTALTIGTVVVAAYVVIIGLLWRYQERIVFQPPSRPESPDKGTGTITYTSTDGVRLLAHVVQVNEPDAPIVLAFHGNAMISRWMLPWAWELSRRFRATVVLPEYRGYDGLGGKPTYDGARLDAAAALEAVEAHFGKSADQLVYYGHSLGTAIAAELAAEYPPRAMLLESPLTSARDMAARYPVVGLPRIFPAISRVHYDTQQRVRQLDVPVHVAHGERDLIIPARMGRAVHEAAKQPGQLLLIPGAGHNDVALAGGDAYWDWIEQAVRPRPR